MKTTHNPRNCNCEPSSSATINAIYKARKNKPPAAAKRKEAEERRKIEAKKRQQGVNFLSK